jgi:DNA modification methylase
MKVAKLLERSCIGIEINPDYVEMIKEKVGFWQQDLNSNIEYEIVSLSDGNVLHFSSR